MLSLGLLLGLHSCTNSGAQTLFIGAQVPIKKGLHDYCYNVSLVELTPASLTTLCVCKFCLTAL